MTIHHDTYLKNEILRLIIHSIEFLESAPKFERNGEGMDIEGPVIELAFLIHPEDEGDPLMQLLVKFFPYFVSMRTDADGDLTSAWHDIQYKEKTPVNIASEILDYVLEFAKNRRVEFKKGGRTR